MTVASNTDWGKCSGSEIGVSAFRGDFGDAQEDNHNGCMGPQLLDKRCVGEIVFSWHKGKTIAGVSSRRPKSLRFELHWVETLRTVYIMRPAQPHPALKCGHQIACMIVDGCQCFHQAFQLLLVGQNRFTSEDTSKCARTPHLETFHWGSLNLDPFNLGAHLGVCLIPSSTDPLLVLAASFPLWFVFLVLHATFQPCGTLSILDFPWRNGARLGFLLVL